MHAEFRHSEVVLKKFASACVRACMGDSFLCVSVCVCVHVRALVCSMLYTGDRCTQLYTHINKMQHTHVMTCICSCIFLCNCTDLYACICKHIYADVHTDMYFYMKMHLPMYLQRCMHIHIYSCL